MALGCRNRGAVLASLSLWRTTPFIRDLLSRHCSKLAPRFSGGVLTATAAVSERARTTYSRDRM